MYNQSPQNLMKLVWLLDFLVVLLSVLIFNVWSQQSFIYNEAHEIPGVIVALGLALAFSWGQVYGGSYSSLGMTPLRQLLISVSAALFALGSLFLVTFIFKETYTVDRFLVVSAILLGAALSFMMRCTIYRWHWYKQRYDPTFRTQVLMIGTGSRAAQLANHLFRSSDWGVDIVGFVGVKENEDKAQCGESDFLGYLEDLDKILSSKVVDEVIVAVPRRQLIHVEEVFSACSQQGIAVKMMTDIYPLDVKRLRLDTKANVPLLEYLSVYQNEYALLVKRCVDILLVVLALPVILPVFLLISLALRLDSNGPIFFVQKRVGFRKRVFSMIKFRSMVVDAESKLKEIEHLNEAEGPNFKITNDPRITRVGGFLRKTSLDELPQLINVLMGHMTLVGPRPMSLRDVELFDKAIQHKRFSVLPGITCLWQISGRSNLSFDQWLALDLEYIDNWSLGLDLKILFKTIPVILKGEGAV